MTIMDVLVAYPGALIAITTIVGLLVGSFLNVVAYRLPLMLQREWQQQCRALLEIPAAEAGGETQDAPLNLVRPGSRCPHCGAAVRAWQNIPVISYLLLRGRCASCRGRISPRYPVVEAVSGALAALVAWHWGLDGMMPAALVFAWSLLALTLIDLDHQILPDQITLPLLWLGLLTGKEGMGYGDFKLLAALGAWMGWQKLLLIVLLSSFVGAVVGLGLLLFLRRDRDLPIPFGPYLAGAGLITLLWGDPLIRGYLQFMGISG